MLITSVTSGARLETYAIAGRTISGVICMNRLTAHLIKVGEIVVIMGFELSDKPILPKIILVDENNNFTNFVE